MTHGTLWRRISPCRRSPHGGVRCECPPPDPVIHGARAETGQNACSAVRTCRGRGPARGEAPFAPPNFPARVDNEDMTARRPGRSGFARTGADGQLDYFPFFGHRPVLRDRSRPGFCRHYPSKPRNQQGATGILNRQQRRFPDADATNRRRLILGAVSRHCRH